MMDLMMLPGMENIAPSVQTPASRGWAATVHRHLVQCAVDAASWTGIVLPYCKMAGFLGGAWGGDEAVKWALGK
jgi:hypothetical protein